MTAAPLFREAQQVPSAKIELFAKRDFLSAEKCARLIERIEANLRPSTLADHEGDGSFRTSQTCDLAEADPLVAAINARIAAFTGLDPAHGEPMQGQRYCVGEEFKLHTDYFEPFGQDWDRYCAKSGQRSWTAMIYLNMPAAGGATRFKRIDKTIAPETGKLLCWHNLLPDGRPNPMTLHQGMKVRSGVKYIITKWYRQLPWRG